MSSKIVHCLILPYPNQGHINPMLQFSKRLQSRGIKITLAVTKYLLKTAMQEVSGSVTSTVSIEAISDGFDDGGRAQAPSWPVYITRLNQVGRQTVTQLIQKLNNMNDPVHCIIYDPFLPWAVEVAKEFGIPCAGFFTQSCTVDVIYYHVHKGLLQLPPPTHQVSVPGFSTIETLSTIEASDIPAFASRTDSERIVQMLTDQFCNLDKADWVLINTIYDLEKQVIDWMGKIYSSIKTIGPTIPSMYIDKQLPNDNEYGFSMFKPITESCLNWLNHKPIHSVVYVSFGSIASLEAEQMEEIAWGLKKSNKNFLWVVRSTEESKLPNNFAKEFNSDNEKGLVVSWCPQLQVLAHESIGCFVTHCGWNSTLEALSLGVPMVAMPQWLDQPTNAKLVKDMWGVGVKPKADDKGIVRREVIEECINQVMEEEKGKRIWGNSIKWKELVTRAVTQGGTTDANIDEFVSELLTIANQNPQ